MSKKTCYVCSEPIEGEAVESENCRTGNVWYSHEDCPYGPTPDSYAFTARLMADMYPDEDWDAWKEEMKMRDDW
jgi:hypothetical protein